MKRVLAIAILVFITGVVSAQKKRTVKKPVTSQRQAASVPDNSDTIPARTVIVTSVFQPTLKTTAKVNFSAAIPSPDTSRPQLQYNVPAQNLVFTYQSPALKALAEAIDTSVQWENKNFIKAGYGNFTTPYLQAGLSFGDGVNSVVNIHGKYTASKGTIPFQQFSKTSIEGIGIFSGPASNNEWNSQLFFDNNIQYQYGFKPDTLKFVKDDLRNSFTSFGGKLGVRNKAMNEYGIAYNPNISLQIFNDNHSSSENNFVVNLPVSKSFGKIYAFSVGLNADITSFKSDSAGTVDNNLYFLTPAVQFKTPNFNLSAGIMPAWDNEIFSLLPNITAEAKIKDEKFILMAGWIGYFNKTTYASLASVNPWLQPPTFLLNTRIREQYAGFKGSAGNHFTYNAKVSYLNINNQPLFVNDTINGKSFIVVNESEMKDIRIHGEIGFTMQEKFSLLAGATFNQYSNLKDNEKPWGLLPIEINGALRWHVTKDVLLRSDVFFWDGAQYRSKSLQSQKLQPAVDVNAGVEFMIMPKLNVWLQFNNLFNNRYQRWNQYEVLGFNVLAGVVYSFSQLAGK